MAIAVFRAAGEVRSAAAGVQVAGEAAAPVAPPHRFHIGSTTKSMTALLVAQLVDEGALRYDTRLGDVLDVPMREEYAAVTVRDLLLSRSGLLAWQVLQNEEPEHVVMLGETIPGATPDPREQRRRLAAYVLALPPRFSPGSRGEYSNVGWSVLGHVIETVAGASYEELLQERIFLPLAMIDARVGGWPATSVDPAQPRGHYVVDRNGTKLPQPLDDTYVLPPWMNPAGGVHCSIDAYARYAQEVLRGLRGDGRLLGREGYAEMHRVQSEDRVRDFYQGQARRKRQAIGYGWGLYRVGDAYLSVADGSAGTFYARIALLPELEVGFVGFTNAGDGEPALSQAIGGATGLPW